MLLGIYYQPGWVNFDEQAYIVAGRISGCCRWTGDGKNILEISVSYYPILTLKSLFQM